MAFWDRLRKEHIVAGEDFNRLKVPPASIAIHLCIGSVYAWSIFNPALIKEIGVVTSALLDKLFAAFNGTTAPPSCEDELGFIAHVVKRSRRLAMALQTREAAMAAVAFT